MCVVRFIRKDMMQDEEYYYSSLADARWHFNLFADDDSGLYRRVELCNENILEDVLLF